MGQSIASLAFASNGVLYGVTGDCRQGLCGGGTIPETLYTVNTNNASLTFFKTLGNGDNGEAIAFNPNDGMMYHMSGVGAGLIFEKINLGTGVITPIPLSGDPVGPYETIGFTFDAAQNLFLGSLIDCLCNNDSRSFFKLTADGVLKHVNTLPAWWKDYAFHDVPHVDWAALPDVDESGSADAVVLVEELASAQAALTPGVHIFVRDGATGNAIAQRKVFNARWRAIDLAATQNGANSLVAVLAQKDDGTINVALHRAASGAPVRKIVFFNANWMPTALIYVPQAEGAGGHAFAVLAKNRNDDRISVQLRRRSDGSLINTTTYFKNIWEPVDLDTIADISDNNRPEIVALARNDDGKIMAVIRDAESAELVNRITYLNKSMTPKGITVIAGTGNAPELPVLAVRSNYRHVVQNRDSATDGLAGNIAFLGPGWTSLDVGGLQDVNGNSSADIAVLAEHFSSRAIQVQVLDSVTGDRIRAVIFLSSNWDSQAFAVFDDIDGNGVQELGVVARNNNGDVRVQIRDAATGKRVKSFNIP
jgi:hypothetical protein